MINWLKPVGCDETFFLLEKLPESLKKVTHKVVDLNYSLYSPFKNSNFFYLTKDGYLMIWYYPQEKGEFSYPNCISFLLPYIEDNYSGILLRKEKENYIVFPIKNGVIQGQYITSPSSLNSVLENLKLKYKVNEVKNISDTDKNILKLYKVVAEFYIRKIIEKISQDYKTSLNFLLKVLIIGNILYLLLLGMKIFILSFEIKKIKIAESNYANLAFSTKKKFFLMENKAEEWNKIMINYPYMEELLSNLLSAMKDSSVQQINSLSVFYIENQKYFKIYMDVVTKGAPDFLSKIASLEKIKNVRIIDSYPLHKAKLYKILIETTPISYLQSRDY